MLGGISVDIKMIAMRKSVFLQSYITAPNIPLKQQILSRTYDQKSHQMKITKADLT